MRAKITIIRFDKLNSDLADTAAKVEEKLTERVKKDTDPYVPYREGKFFGATDIKNNLIIYQGDQVRYLYEGKRMVNSVTGKGPMHWLNEDGEMVYRWKKGTKLVATNQPLHYTKTVHKKATDHWMDASEEKNIEKWAKYVEKEIGHGL